MADTKISALTAAASAAGANEIPINEAGTTKKLTVDQLKTYVGGAGMNNLLKNGNFINNSTNGYGSTPDDWTNSNANPVQGGFPALTKQQLIDLLGIADGDIEGLWNLNEASGNATDLSSNAYHLTDTNTVQNSADGLMAGGARDFEKDNSEYFTIADASCANLEIAGSQTWFAFVKAESLTNTVNIMAKLKNSVGQTHQLYINASGTVVFWLNGLTTNANITSDVKLETGKWYLVVGRYNSSTQLLLININAINKQVTASGSANDTNAPFAIGANFNGASDTATEFFDGLIQCACVLSVALTDSQVKKLFAATLYRGQKIRRATTDAVLSQALPEDLVERLRGKNVSIVGRMYQEVASKGQISLDDGTETLSATSATTGSWVNVGATATISATATAITLRLRHSTTDGNTWFKEVAFYEGSTLVYVWYPSYDDISRCSNLLKMYFPQVLNGYSFEEKRWYKYIPSVVSDGDIQSLSDPYDYLAYSINGKTCTIGGTVYDATITGTPNTVVTMGLPVKTASMKASGFDTSCMLHAQSRLNASTIQYAFAQPAVSFGATTVDVALSANYSNGQLISLAGTYEID